MRISVILLFFISFSFTLFSQEIGEEVRDGQRYKIHIVEAGNTLYGLHKKYDVEIESILEANPSAKEGLQIGQRLYIPVPFEKPAENLVFTLHKVKKKETLYGISRMYDCTVEEIIKANPEVEEGLKVGQQIKIPVKDDTAKKVDQPETTKDENQATEDNGIKPENDEQESIYQVELSDSVIKYEVQKGETLYSIARRYMVPVEELVEANDLKGSDIKPGQVLVIPLKKEEIKVVEDRDITRFPSGDYKRVKRPNLVGVKSHYKILIALPMELTKNQKILSGMYDENTELHNLTDISVSFLMGAQMALDSLEKLGLSGDVEFFDTEGNLEKFKNFLGTGNEKQIDIIIGPFYEKLLSHAASWGRQNRVPVIAVTKISTKLLENNPFLLSTVPSDLTLIGGMAKYLAKHHAKDNIVLIEGETEATKEYINYFKNVYNRNLAEGGNALKMSTIGSETGSAIASKLDAKKENYVVCLSKNVPTVMRFVTALNNAKNNYHKKTSVRMVGQIDWKDYATLNSYYKNRFEYHFSSANYLNYEDERVHAFTKEFRARFESDPSKYAVHGFDVVLSQLAYLLLGFDRNQGLMDAFELRSLGENHGSENRSSFISKQADFEIELLELITD